MANKDEYVVELEDSDFRLYCNEKWFEYKEEILSWEKRIVKEKPEMYFQKYKYFLKRQFKAENK